MNSKTISYGAAALLMSSLAAPSAIAGESRGFVVSWFYPAIAAQSAERDCPRGVTPDAATNIIRMLEEQGKTPSEIEIIMADFPNGVGQHIGRRGTLNGEPVSPYTNPTSVPDPNINTVEGSLAYGFNLNGEISEHSFTDPETGEQGVDSQLFRAWGCMGVMRADPGTRPTWPSIQWNTVQQQMPAWLIQINGIDDYQNDPEVQVRIVQATSPVLMSAAGVPQADLTFQEDTNPVTKNEVRGSIKDGVLTTDSFTLSLNGHRWAWSELRMSKARLRLKFNDDGTAVGFLGGYHPWAPIYTRHAEGGSGYESMLSMDLPGMYYALRKMADADPDPETGLNLSISATFSLELEPAFIIPSAVQTASQQ
jgi:hypothetical protein